MIRRVGFTRLVQVLMVFIAFMFLYEPLAHAQASAKRAALRLSRQALRAEKRKKHEDAARLYKEAFELFTDYGYLFSAGKNCEAINDIDCAMEAYRLVSQGDVQKPLRASDARMRLERLEDSIKVSLQIRLTPAGTETELNGQIIGNATIQAVKLLPGKHLFVFRHPGHGEERREVAAVRGTELPPLDVVLKKLEGHIVVNTDQTGAQLFINGHLIGPLPLQEPVLVQSGEHMIHIELAEFEPIDKLVRVEPGATLLENFSMRPIPKLEVPVVEEEPPPPPSPVIDNNHTEPVIATHYTPFVGPQATHHFGLELTSFLGWQSGQVQYTQLFTPIIEAAPAPRWFTFAVAPRFFVSVNNVRGQSFLQGLHSGDFGFKITPYDDRSGNAVSILVLGRLLNQHGDGFHVDSIGPGGGAMASVSAGPVRFLGSAHAVHMIKTVNDASSITEFSWQFQPSWDILDSGHYLFLNFKGYLPIVGGHWSHDMDGGIGYAYAGEYFKASFMLSIPFTNRTPRGLEDMQINMQALSHLQ